MSDALIKDGEFNDYILCGGSCWITIGKLSIWIRRVATIGTTEVNGIRIEVYKKDHEAEEDPISTAYADQPKE